MDKSVALEPVVPELPEGQGQGSARHSVCCVSALGFLWLLSNLERVKCSDLQHFFSSQMGDRRGKRSDNFSNISMILCPICCAHLHIDLTDKCHQCPSTICVISESYWGSGETTGFLLVDLILQAAPALMDAESRQ